MTRLGKGISLIVGVLIIFVLFYLYVQHKEHERIAEPPEDHQTVVDTSLPNRLSEQSPPQDTAFTKAAPSLSSNGEAESEFVIFDGTNYHPKPPQIYSSGLKPIDVVYSTRMFNGKNAQILKKENAKELPPREEVYDLAGQAAQVNDRFGVIDIEHWILNPEKGVSDAEIQANLERHLTVLEWYQQAEPDMNWGYYGEVPIRNYWAAIRSRTSERYQRWMQANDRIKPLADKVDAFFISLYTFYDDREGWVRYAREHIAEARRLNPSIPVYVYLWPEYHMSNAEIGLQPIEPDFWRLQLETARKYSDGAVIYTRGKVEFDPSAPWWNITKSFLNELNNPSNTEASTSHHRKQ